MQLTGDVAARVTTELSFKVGGKIKERKVEVGQHVGAGEVLATLDPREQQASVTAAQAGVEGAEAQLKQATSTAARQRSLIGPGFTTRGDYDQAETSLRSAEASLVSSKAQLANAQDQLNDTIMRATAPGVVTSRKSEAGEVVQAAATVLVVAEDGPRDAVFNVPEALFMRQRTDEAIQVALTADPKTPRPARLREISPAVDTASGTVRVKFEIDNPTDAMTLGASVTGTGRFVPVRVFALPWTALSTDAGRPAVWVVDPASKVVSLKQVTLALYKSGQVLLRAGLQPGALVVARGQQLLWPGQVVEPVQEPGQ